MSLAGFNFQNTPWLWALALVPIIRALGLLKTKFDKKTNGADLFADKHLLPHLLKYSGAERFPNRKSFVLWAALWTFGILALAGPRWDFKDVPNFKPHKSVVMLLDLSDSMNAKDIRPSRLIRAREKIEDFLSENPDTNIGLIGFAGDAHLISPITEDKTAIRYLLNAVSTDIISVHGKRLRPALILAGKLLSEVAGQDRSILVFGDGNFEDTDLGHELNQLTQRGINVSIVGIGTPEGAPISNSAGRFMAQDGRPIISKLNVKELESLANEGHGQYFSQDDSVVVSRLFSVSKNLVGVSETNSVIRDWEPRFYIFLIPLLLLILPLFRKQSQENRVSFSKLGFIFVAVSALGLSSQSMAAESQTLETKAFASVSNIFKNQATLGKEALEKKDFVTAETNFDDAYRKGVVEYRAGDFNKAEEFFKKSDRPELAIAAKYNLGNSLAQEKKFEDAIKAYEEVLKADPQHENAQANLKLIQDLLKKQKENPKQNPKQNQEKQNDQDQKQDQKQAQNQKSDQGKKQSKDQKQAGKQSPNQGNEQKQDQNFNQDQTLNQAQGQNAQPKSAADQKQPNPILENKEAEIGVDQNRYDKQIIAKKTPQDVDADQWLNRISNDPHGFLKNQFLIESMRMKKQKGEQL